MIRNPKNDEARLIFQVGIAAVAGAIKVLCDREIINIKPRVQPPEADPAHPHFFTGDYVAESLMVAGQAAIDIVDAMDPANQVNDLPPPGPMQ